MDSNYDEYETPFGSFSVECSECGSKNIDLENSLGFSVESGSWGSIDLVCADCGNRFEIYES
jgi:hypothetical protein